MEWTPQLKKSMAITLGVYLGAVALAWIFRVAIEWSMVKWIFSEGFWGSFVSFFVFTIAGPAMLSLVGGCAKILNVARRDGFSNRAAKIAGFVLACFYSVVFVTAALTMQDVFSFAKVCWWEGFWNTMMSIGAYFNSIVGVVAGWIFAVGCPLAMLGAKTKRTAT